MFYLLWDLYGHLLHVSKHIDEFVHKAGKSQAEILERLGKE